MRFIKFPSIENTYNSKELAWVITNTPVNAEWVATEKLHGSNFSFNVDKSGEVKLASRNGFTDEGFFGYGSSEDYAVMIEKVKNMAKVLMPEDSIDDAQITLFGELVGPKIQKGVYYGDDKRFYAFKLVLSKDDNELVVNYDQFIEVCKMFGIPTAPLRGRGTLQEMLNLPNEFDSVITGKPNNVAEGLVIEPVVAVKVQESYVMLKNKNDKFKENSRVPKEPKSIPEVDNELIFKLKELVNPNRIDSAISKLGLDITLMSDYINEVRRDVFKELDIEFNKEAHGSLFGKVSKDIVTHVKQRLSEV